MLYIILLPVCRCTVHAPDVQSMEVEVNGGLNYTVCHVSLNLPIRYRVVGTRLPSWRHSVLSSLRISTTFIREKL